MTRDITDPRYLAGAVVGAIVALLAVLGGVSLAAAATETDPPVWPQVTRCSVVMPEDLDRVDGNP